MGPPGRQTTGSPREPRRRKASAVPSGAEKIGIPDPATPTRPGQPSGRSPRIPSAPREQPLPSAPHEQPTHTDAAPAEQPSPEPVRADPANPRQHLAHSTRPRDPHPTRPPARRGPPREAPSPSRLSSPLPREISLQRRQPMPPRELLDLRRITPALDQHQQPHVLLD